MRRVVFGFCLFLVAVSGFSMADAVRSAAFAQYSRMSCGDLWYARNRIYARKGYCFETARAIRVFGRRCYPPFGRLNAGERQTVNEIQYWEARRGC